MNAWYVYVLQERGLQGSYIGMTNGILDDNDNEQIFYKFS